MESTENKCSVVKIESVQNKNLVIETLADYRAKDKVKTSTYYLNLANGSKENQDISYVSIDNVSQENTQFDNGPIEDSTTEYVAVEVQDSGQIILHEKNVILWDELCRICANGCDQFIPIFTGEGFENNLSQKIHEYLPIQISENDDLPHQLCYNCASTLIAYDDIYKGCISAQERLNSLQSKLNKQELVNNSIAEDDDHFEQVLEDKTEEIDVNKDKLEENGDALDENYEEGDRLKDIQTTSSTFKELKKTYKHSQLSIKNRKRLQTTTKPIKKRVNHTAKKKVSKNIIRVKTELDCTKENEQNLEVLGSTNTIKVDTDASPEASTSKSLKPKKTKKISSSIRQCQICSKRFRDLNCYEAHMRIHSGEKPYSCHICGKQFGPIGSLYYHLKHVHEGVKNHACDICGRCFAMKSAMEDHRRIHTGERPFVCDSCGKTFRTKASLFIHSKVHSNEYPFKCSYCKKLFRWKHQMINHETTHTGEKNHICDICGKGFGVKNELSRHRFTHSVEKPFNCPKCDLSFGQKRYLTKHIRTRH